MARVGPLLAVAEQAAALEPGSLTPRKPAAMPPASGCAPGRCRPAASTVLGSGQDDQPGDREREPQWLSCDARKASYAAAVLIGREAELRDLLVAAAAVRAGGRFTLALVCGEPGIGNPLLLDRVESCALPADTQVSVIARR